MIGSLYQKRVRPVSQDCGGQQVAGTPTETEGVVVVEDTAEEEEVAWQPPIRKKNFESPPAPATEQAEPVQVVPVAPKAHGRPGRPRKPENLGDDRVYLTAKIDKALHERISIMSVRSGKSLKAIIETWIQTHTPQA